MSFGRVGLMAFLVAALSGCYIYTAAPATPAPGAHLLLDLTDRGRVALGDSIGSGATALEGTTISSTDSAYSLRVTRVSYLNGLSNDWTGEPLVIPRDLVTNAKERRFSRSRSWITAAVVGAGIVAFITSRGLLGFGGSESEGGTPPPNEN